MPLTDEESGASAGLCVFTVRAKVDCKDVKTDRTGWSKDTKVISDTAVTEQT